MVKTVAKLCFQTHPEMPRIHVNSHLTTMASFGAIIQTIEIIIVIII